ncbi:MAG: acyl-CoA dehydrogenase family protein [Dehalococcoidia bacterium]|nr:acyl-CoA dehydrogenase family protein [Dehalococcoidia bacterium]
MDFDFSPSEEQFRAELRQLLHAQLPSDWSTRSLAQAPDAEERRALARTISKQLADRKWLAMAWPKEHGGLAASYLEQLIFNEELAYLDAPGNGGVGVSSVGPAIMMNGNEAQRRLYLPRIANADDVWCALYSEPGAGSDLASIQTRAVRDGDEYIVSGTKLWVAGAQEANLGYLAARTDPNAPKHRGISTFVLPMDSAGITMRPIASMAGDSYLTEVHLDRVRIPAENLVGVENRGWYQLARSLDFERSSVAAYAGGKRNIERLVNLAKEDGGLIEQHPSMRYALADRWIEMEVGFNIAYRIPWMQTQGISPNYEASVSKLYGSELTQRIAGTGMQMLGYAGLLVPGSPLAPFGGGMARSYLESVGSTIAAGTSEVQRNIIAQRGLGLPR